MDGTSYFLAKNVLLKMQKAWLSFLKPIRPKWVSFTTNQTRSRFVKNATSQKFLVQNYMSRYWKESQRCSIAENLLYSICPATIKADPLLICTRNFTVCAFRRLQSSDGCDQCYFSKYTCFWPRNLSMASEFHHVHVSDHAPTSTSLWLTVKLIGFMIIKLSSMQRNRSLFSVQIMFSRCTE